MTDGIPKKPDGTPLWYGRRFGHRLRPGRRRLIDTLLPRLRVAETASTAPVDPAAVFGRSRPLYLEIGFGAGEHLAGMAAAAPDADFIGCEPFVNGVASLLADIDARGLTNVRIFDDDARLLLDRLPDRAVDGIYVLFPDPWPKLRHHRRRFIQTETLDQLARIAVDGASLLFASDHMDYVAWTLTHARRHPDWAWTARRASDWRRPPADWVPTRYEAKARRQGLAPVYLGFERRQRNR